MCGVCQTIQETIEGKNRYFVRELETGYVVIGDYQRIKGYTLFLCKVHATEIHFLERPFRETFLNEMSLVAEAVYNAFGPDKLNYELLGRAKMCTCTGIFFPEEREILRSRALFGSCRERKCMQSSTCRPMRNCRS